MLSTAGGEQSMCTGLDELVSSMKKHKIDADAHLTPFMAAESQAFIALLRRNLEPMREHELFCVNYADIYSALVNDEAAWPLRHFEPMMRRRAVQRRLAGWTEGQLESEAERVVEALATRLGDRHGYFYGEKPGVLDAVVFAQLAVALLVPLSRPKLRAIVGRYSNLVAFVERIRDAYFNEDFAFDVQEAAQTAVEDARRRVEEFSRRKAASQKHSAESAEEKARRQGNVYFIWASVAVFAAHLLLSDLDVEMMN